MNTELKNKIEEAVEQKMPEVIRINPAYTPSYHCGFENGAEWGYKEAIEAAKEWMKTNMGNQAEMMCAEGLLMMSKEAIIADFERDINKFLEDDK